jgi:excisionase family DNA binding protein
MAAMAADGRDSGSTQFIDPRSFGLFRAAYSVKETLDLLSIGRTKFYELVDQGELKIAKLGNKSLVYAIDIAALLIKLRAASEAHWSRVSTNRGLRCTK